MSKPRVFVSSTYFDLRHIRRGIESFIESLGYDAVLFESGDIPFTHLDTLDQSCYREIEACHIMVLIIGGRYGSRSNEEGEIDSSTTDTAVLEYNSITKKEYETARNKDIPIYIFLEKGVANEYRTYKENKANPTIVYAHVDSVNIFRLLDDIYFQKRNNLTHEFENISDIVDWLRNQWAGLFGFLLSRQSNESQLSSLQSQLSQLKSTSDVLKAYTESIMRGAKPVESEKLITEMEQKLKIQKMNRVLRIQPIRYLIRQMINPPSEEVIYQAILDCDDVQSFMKRFKLNDNKIHRSTDGIPPHYMLSDYTKLKNMIELDQFDEDEPGDLFGKSVSTDERIEIASGKEITKRPKRIRKPKTSES